MAAPVVCMEDGRAKLIGFTRPGQGAKRSQSLTVANVVGYKIEKAAKRIAYRGREVTNTTESTKTGKNGSISIISDLFCLSTVLINSFL